MKYMDDVRVDPHYALPLGEIVHDFFDAIKSREPYYASYDYEFKEYRESDRQGLTCSTATPWMLCP